MNKPNVFISRQLPDIARALLSEAVFKCQIWDHEIPMPQNALIEHCQGMDALLCTAIDKIDAALYDACPDLKIISTFAVGYDNIDLAGAGKAGIRIGHTPGVLTEATAEIAFGLMVAVARHFLDAHRQIPEGSWKYFVPTRNLGQDLQRKTLGILGLGAIGFEMARRCKAVYDMQIIYHNRGINEEAEKTLGARKVTFEELLKQSDVLSVHASLNAQTKEIFNQGAFSQMKEEAIFINTARGGLHCEQDLIEALASGSIWGAGLDVTNPEPMHADNPLLKMPRVIVLPHIGSSTVFTRDEMARIAAQNIIHFFTTGKLLHEVETKKAH
ncbi:MAG: D-glycerate dehydrogenase [Saprospiraceae bacterium]|nr:D-glycerate dehydrogenase [Saprospiraceae bacterium]